MTVEQQDDKPASMSSVDYCLQQVREQILTGRLLPGEKVLQAELAGELRVSRIPLREALSRLQAEGLLTHRRNSGYQVARFSPSELSEIYLMRRLLETELIRTATLGEVLADSMYQVNEQIRRSTGDDFLDLNEKFHFLLFESSPLRLVRKEVSNLWYRSGFYRSVYLQYPSVTDRVLNEHAEIIEAARESDIERLIHACGGHRSGTEGVVPAHLTRGP